MLLPKMISELGSKNISDYSYTGKGDIIEKRAIIEWETEIEIRDWGIKSITPLISKISLSIMVQHIDENDKDTEECIDFPWSELCHWDIDTRFEKSFSKMEINFSEKKIILE